MTIQTSEQPDAFRAFELEGWQTNSAGYDRHFGPITRQAVEPTLDAAGVGPGMRVLDVCTGPGILAEAALARGAEAVGLDFAPAWVAAARGRVRGAEFIEGDAQALPFPDAAFDAVVCGFGIIHLPDPAAALAEMRRVLRPGGRAAVSLWAAPAPDNGLGVFFAAVRAHGDLGVALPHGPDFFQFSAPEKLEAALGTAGFRAVGSRAVPQEWRIEEPTGIVTGIVEGTVRARALFLAQAAPARRAIADAVAEAAARFALTGGGYAVPMPALVGWGTP